MFPKQLNERERSCMKIKKVYHRVWLKRAKQSLNFCKIPDITKYDLAYEDLCFQAFQAAEKALQAFLIFLNVEIISPNLSYMLQEISKHVALDERMLEVHDLSEFDLYFKYPNGYVQLSKDDITNSFEVAKYCIYWVEKQISQFGQNQTPQLCSSM
jgi:HEPN domain-containing protein